jgi:ribosome biogenesis GTPase A
MTVIQWYPGHMAKAKRNIEADMAAVDLSIVVLDARIPASSYNPDFDAILNQKPRLVVLNKSDLADPEITKKWLADFEKRGIGVVALNARNKQGVKELLKKIQLAAEPVMQALLAKGRRRRPIRAMVVGSPNTGKSTLINCLMPRATSKTGNRPGVTRGKQWVRINDKVELLDTPGVLWPKFEKPEVAFALAVTGAISTDVYDTHDVCLSLLAWIAANKPGALSARFKLTDESGSPEELLLAIGKNRGLLAAGGAIREDEAARLVLAEFRNGKLGRFTLDQLP